MGGLKQIAEEMRTYAIAHPRTSSEFDIDKYRRKLTGGLRLVLFVDINHEWSLSAYRLGVFPSPREIDVLEREFEIPADAEISRRRLPANVPEGQQWHIVRLRWREVKQKKLFDVGPVEPDDIKYF